MSVDVALPYLGNWHRNGLRLERPLSWLAANVGRHAKRARVLFLGDRYGPDRRAGGTSHLEG